MKSKRLSEIIIEIWTHKQEDMKLKFIPDLLDDDRTDLRDLGFDSLDFAELMVKVKYEFGVDIFENGLITIIGEIDNAICV